MYIPVYLFAFFYITDVEITSQRTVLIGSNAIFYRTRQCFRIIHIVGQVDLSRKVKNRGSESETETLLYYIIYDKLQKKCTKLLLFYTAITFFLLVYVNYFLLYQSRFQKIT